MSTWPGASSFYCVDLSLTLFSLLLMEHFIGIQSPKSFFFFFWLFKVKNHLIFLFTYPSITFRYYSASKFLLGILVLNSMSKSFPVLL